MANGHPKHDTFYKSREEIKLMLDLQELRENTEELLELVILAERRYDGIIQDLRRELDELKAQKEG